MLHRLFQLLRRPWLDPVAAPRLAARLSGFLLFLSDYPAHWWWLHPVALVPLMWSIIIHHKTGRPLWLLGWAFGTCYMLPLLICAGGAAPIIAAAILGMFQWPLMLLLLQGLLARRRCESTVSLSLMGAAVITLCEICLWNGLELFGTATCFARVMSAAPWAVQFASWTGMAGVVWVLVFGQCLAAQTLVLWREPSTRRQGRSLACWGLSVMITLALSNFWLWTRPLGPEVTVATIGSRAGATIDLGRQVPALQRTRAHVLVSPECGIEMSATDGKNTQPLQAIATQAQAFLALGICHFRANRYNQIHFYSPNEGRWAPYHKTHLIPLMENYPPGSGELITAQESLRGIGPVRIGGLICQDDNFTDLTRRYGREGTQLLTVPTNDWKGVNWIHFENARFRAIENRYAVARAATGGVSAVISPRGEVISAHDHLTDPRSEASLHAGTVAVGRGVPTLYALCGDWLMAGVCAVSVMVALCLGALSRQRPATP